MDEKALEARRKYFREYYATHPEAREKKNEYARKWRQKNKERIKRYNELYWQKKASEMKLDQ